MVQQTTPVQNTQTSPASRPTTQTQVAPATGQVAPGKNPIQTERKSIFKKWWFWLIIVVILIVLGIGAWLLLR